MGATATDDYEGGSLIAAAQHGDTVSVRALLDGDDDDDACGCVDDRGSGTFTPLMAAARAGHAEVVTALLAFDANAKARDSESGRTALAMAAGEGHEAVVGALLASPGAAAAVDCMSYDGETALMLAAASGHAGVVRMLLEARADGDAASHVDGLTALMKATRNGHGRVVRLLLERGSVGINAKRSVKTTKRKRDVAMEVYGGGGGGETALMLAVVKEHVDVVEALLSHGADVGIKCVDGATDALTLALERRNRAVEMMLVEAGGADLHGALMWAVRAGDHRAVRFLANHGADLNRAAGPGPGGTTPLAAAALAGARRVVSLLIAKGAMVQGQFVSSAGAGRVKLVKLFLSEGAEVDDPSDECGVKEVALSAAARRGHRAVVEYLLSVGADVDGRKDKTRTPLMQAAAAGFADVAALLVEHGADVNAKGELDGFSALDYAASCGSLKVVTLLLQSGADVNSRSNKNRTALHWARFKKHEDVAEMLELAGGVT